MPWILETYDAGVFAATFNVIDSSKAVVSCDLLKLNDGKVICPSTTPIDVDQEVKIVDKVIDPITKQVLEKHTLLHGYVQKYSQVTKGELNNTYEYTVKELAVELEKYRVHTVGNSYTVNCDPQNTSEYVSTICYGTSWTYASGVVNQALQGIQFRYMTGIAALNKIITSLTAASAATPLYMWFNSTVREVGWGQYRNDLTAATNFTKGVYYNYKEEKTVRNQVAGVVIFGANSAYSGYYPDPLPTDQHDLAVYEYDDATSNAECTQIATAVWLTWCADPKRRIQFFVRPADTKIGGQYMLEGDRIKVDGVNYTIVDMTYTPKSVQVGVNAGEDSALYSLGDKLRPVAGTATGASEIVWAPGTQSVASDYTKTLFALDISDKDNIQGNVMMNVTIGPYKVYSYPAPTLVSAAPLTIPNPGAVYGIDGNMYHIYHGNNQYYPMNDAGYLNSGVCEGGFEYGLMSITLSLLNDDATNGLGARFYVVPVWSVNGGSTWHEGTIQYKVTLGKALDPDHSYGRVFSCTFIVPGHMQTCELLAKWRVYCADISHEGDAYGYWIYDISCAVDVVKRHDHTVSNTGGSAGTVTVNQTEGLKTSDVPPPAIVVCSINGGTGFNVSSDNPVNITSQLISGHNTIEFSSGTVCTVTPSSTYVMFGG